MNQQLETKVSVGQSYGRGLGNLTLENAKFFGRPNFSGEEDRFKDSRRKFTVQIPNEAADELRALGWNVKTTIPQSEEQDPISHLKVMVDFRFDENHPGDVAYEKGSDIWVIMGEQREKLTSLTAGILDRSRILTMDMEIRAWNYNASDVLDGADPEYSARLVAIVATINPSLLSSKYGILG